MNRNSPKRLRGTRQSRASHRLMIAFVVLMVAGVFIQIAMIARLTAQNKQMHRVEREIVELKASADNLNLTLNQYGNLERVAKLAAKLGMQEPQEGQIRVMNLPDALGDTSAQNAANTGAEESKE